ncbi:hypothetical protein Q1695_012197 [Nippostrongylus brasiliensis]|nr:hypothetical protein Q1695_012197 [Nippostrongylus brasiliensis]
MKYRPTRIPTRFQKELDDHINKLLQAGRIVESDTPWVHNTVLVKKKDGSLRVCLDFRPLNDITIPDHFPLPRIEDILQKVAGNRFYTSLDLASGYMQLRLAPDAQAKCGWATHRGIYQFVYLPFGLRNAGAYFSRAMAQLFNVACSALAALNTLNDDKRTHNLTATVPSLQAFPVRFDFTIPNMTSECGWTSQRPVYLWIVGAETLCRASIQRAHFSFEERALHVRAIAPAYDHRGTMAAITRLGIISGNSATVDIFVKLGRVPSGADPVYEIIASSQLFESADFSGDSRGLQVLDMVYAQSRRGCRSDGLLQYSTTFSVGGSQITLRPEQMEAIRLSDDRFPVVGIQAAFGTGKTVVGAIIAAHSASKPRGGSVVATSTTNTAVAQFVDTLSKLDDYRDVVILRYVSDTALREGAPQTPFDMHTVLKRLHIDFADQLSQGEIELCEQFARGRELLERSLFNPDATLHLTERQREECRIAEKELPKMTTTVVALMFRVRRPSVICLTTAALLNSADKDGLFRTELPQYKTIIGDEASQIPEPAFVAMTTRLCSARHVYIGDVHQLEPHVRCPRTALAARLGARGVMDVLVEKRVPIASLTTTFRAHPSSSALPNTLFYNDELVSGVDRTARRLLLNNSNCRENLPFMFIKVNGYSQRAPNGSHFHTLEAQACRDIIRMLLATLVTPRSLAVITFYKEQYRLLEAFTTQQDVDLYTVDAVQGREKDIVILCTTRTHFEADRGHFLNDARRLNVALTRCKHGLIILGHERSLDHLPNWHRLLEWARERGACFNARALPDLFP